MLPKPKWSYCFLCIKVQVSKMSRMSILGQIGYLRLAPLP